MNNPLASVLISGGSRGIGHACALAFAQKGCRKLVLTGRQIETLQVAKQAIEHQFSECEVHIFQCNHENSDEVQSLVLALKEQGLEPSTIVANVGDNPVHRLGPKKMSSTTIDLLIETFTTNVANAHLLISSFLKHYQRYGGGRIILVGSQAYQWGIKGQLAYNVAKAALLGYKNTLVSEFGGKNVFCHLVNPGLVENQRTQKLRERLGEIETVSEQEVAATICDAVMQSRENGMEINI